MHPIFVFHMKSHCIRLHEVIGYDGNDIIFYVACTVVSGMGKCIAFLLEGECMHAKESFPCYILPVST